MSLYLLVCLVIAGGIGVAAAKSKQLGWFIAGAVALSLLVGVPAIAAPFSELTTGFARVIAGVVGDHTPIPG